MKSKTFLLLSIYLFSFMLSGNKAMANIDTITISGFTFIPSNLTINSGDSVMFFGMSPNHPVAQDNGAWTTFTSNTLLSSEIQSPGTYNYYCTFHGAPSGVGMSGTITVLAGDSLYINEIHYDNSGTDQGEGVEVAGPAGTDLSCYSLLFYNGADSLEDPATTLSGTIPDMGCGYGVVWFPISGIQNGPSDAIGLHNTCNSDVVQFLSYEGTITAIDGPAAGMTSIDIGVSEVGSAIGTSLQLLGTGVIYDDFTWSGPINATPDQMNSGQIFCQGDTTIAFVTSAMNIEESAGVLTIEVSIINPSPSSTFSVDVVYVSGTATSGLDFSYTSPQTLNFLPNDSSNQSTSITIINDTIPEGAENIVLMLQNASQGVTIGNDSVLTITINGNDVVLTSCSDIFYSEYVEGSSNNKALEVYNPTIDTVNLNNYTFLKRTNGPGTINSYSFNGMLAPDDVFVIVNAGGDSLNLVPLGDTSSSLTFFNGDDALAIVNIISGDTIDKFGEWGVDPGTNWLVDTGATSEYTLVRKPSIQQGELYWSDGANEWSVFAQNDFSHLGSHTMTPCAQAITASFSSNSPICITDSACFSDLSTAGAGTINTWFWDFDDGNNSTVQHPCHIYTSAGTYNVTLAIVDDSLNTDTFTLQITITAIPIVAAGANQTVCASSNCIVLAGSVSGSTNTGIWTTSGSGTFSPSDTDLNACYVPDTADTGAGMVSINLTSTNNGNCNSVTDTLFISFIQGPNINIGSMIIDSSTCGNNDGNITGISISGASPLTYLWEDGLSNVVGNNADLLLVPSDCYSLTITDSNSCISSTGPHCIFDAGAPPAPSVGGSGTYCQGDSIGVLTAAGTGNTLYWFSDPLLTDTIGVGSPFISGATATDTFYVAEMGSCLGPANEVIITIDAAASVFAGTDTTFCAGGVAILSGSIGGSASSAIWSSSGDGSFDNSALLNASYTPGSADMAAGTVTLTLTSDDPAGACLAASDSLIISLYPVPIASFTSSATNLLATFTDISTTTSGTIIGWSWDFGDGNTSIVQNPINNYQADGTYQVCLTVTSDQGCVSSASCNSLTLVNVGIAESTNISAVDIYPNPSEDGMVNMSFSGNYYKEARLLVYNIYGEIVKTQFFENISNHVLDLSQCSSGVYFIRISNTSGTITKKVSVL